MNTTQYNAIRLGHFSPAKKKFGKIELKVPGVGIFSDRNPSKVNVLLGRIESDSLQQIANEILDYFVAEGLFALCFNLFRWISELFLIYRFLEARTQSNYCKNAHDSDQYVSW